MNEPEPNPKRVRFYEAKGLLPSPYLTQLGYGKYGRSDVDRIGFITRAKGLGCLSAA